MAPPRVQHKVLTRFNVRTPAFAKWGQHPPHWLDHRVELFERYCVPTMAAQTCQDFEWVVLCDSETDPAILERINSNGCNIRIMLLAAKEDATQGGWHWATTVADFEPDTEVLISTRLDNDDGLHRRAIARVQEFAAPFAESGQERLVHSFELGYKLDVETGRLYSTRRDNSPFLSLLERLSAVRPVGALVKNHTHMPAQYPTTQDSAFPGYVQVLHGGNVSNSLREGDQLVDPSVLGDDFPIEQPARSPGGPA